MPAKMARSAPRPPFGPPEVTVSETRFYLAGRPENREHLPQFGSHPGNPGYAAPVDRHWGPFQSISRTLARYSRLIACGAPPPRRCPGRRQSLINLIEELARDFPVSL